jgi:hypothetical protein
MRNHLNLRISSSGGIAPVRSPASPACRIPAVVATLLAMSTVTPHASGARASDAWPRQMKVPGAVLAVYRPHVDAWRGNRLVLCAAASVRFDDADAKVFGVLWGTARTRIDRVARRVTLRRLRVVRSSFPGLPDDGAAHVRVLRRQLKGVGVEIALDELEASITADRADDAGGARRRSPPPTPAASSGGRMI